MSCVSGASCECLETAHVLTCAETNTSTVRTVCASSSALLCCSVQPLAQATPHHGACVASASVSNFSATVELGRYIVQQVIGKLQLLDHVRDLTLRFVNGPWAAPPAKLRDHVDERRATWNTEFVCASAQPVSAWRTCVASANAFNSSAEAFTETSWSEATWARLLLLAA